MKYKDKIAILSTAMLDVEARCDQLIGATNEPNASATMSVDDCMVVVNHAANALRKARLKVVPARTLMTPEERAAKKLSARMDKKADRMVSWLITNGVKNGEHGVERATGRQVVFMSDPETTLHGVVIDVSYSDDDTVAQNVQAMGFGPDPSIPPTKKPATRPRAASKRAPAKKKGKGSDRSATSSTS